METIILNPFLQSQEKMKLVSLRKANQEAVTETNLADLISALSVDNPWAVRQATARRLGNMAEAESLPKLVEALPGDPFWMVRQAIIQALENIGDVRAIPALEVAAENDSFAVVRAYAAKAVERISNS